jgi:hypothetical protein
MMKGLRLVVLILALVPRSAYAWEEPDSFVGIKWGATKEEAVVALRERGMSITVPPTCDPGRTITGATLCRASVMVDTIVLTGTFRFTDQGFAHASIRFDPSRYPELRAMFVEKYGEPTSTSSKEIGTRSGARLANELLEWMGQKVVLRLERFGGRNTEGAGTVSLRSETDKDE